MLFRRPSERRRFKSEALPHLDSLYRMAVRLSGNPAEAEDLVQEAFQQAWKSFHLYTPNTDCKAWLFRILFRVRNRQMKMARRWRFVDWESVGAERLTESSDSLKQEQAEMLLEIVERLPAHYREALVLADVEGLAYREIAEVLGVPLGTVMSRLNRARRIVRERAEGLQSQRWSA